MLAFARRYDNINTCLNYSKKKEKENLPKTINVEMDIVSIWTSDDYGSDAHVFKPEPFSKECTCAVRVTINLTHLNPEGQDNLSEVRLKDIAKDVISTFVTEIPNLNTQILNTRAVTSSKHLPGNKPVVNLNSLESKLTSQLEYVSLGMGVKIHSVNALILPPQHIQKEMEDLMRNEILARQNAKTVQGHS